MKKESLKKEILTKEKCIQDLLLPTQPMRGPWWSMLLILVPFGLIMGLMLVMASQFADRVERIVVYAVFGSLPLLFVILFVSVILSVRRKNRKIRVGRFHIEQDLLVNAVQDAYYHFPTRYDNGLRDRLDFSGHGSYFLDSGAGHGRGSIYYKWSENYYMTAKGIFNTAIAGDTFYLVVNDDDPERKPVMVYNAKFFDYKEELWENG